MNRPSTGLNLLQFRDPASWTDGQFVWNEVIRSIRVDNFDMRIVLQERGMSMVLVVQYPTKDVRGMRVEPTDLTDVFRTSLDVHIHTEHILPNGWYQFPPKEIARFVRNSCLKALEHELDECFLVGGVRVYDPHHETRQ